MDATHDLHAIESVSLSFIYYIPEDVESLKLETYSNLWFSKGDANLFVDAIVYNASSTTNGTSIDTIVVNNPAPVPHKVTIIPQSSLSKVSLYAITIENNLTLTSLLKLIKLSLKLTLTFLQM